jgi:DNA-binding HxlR family transcriptional regulator
LSEAGGSDHAFLQALRRPAVNVAGVRPADLAPALASLSPATITRRLLRLRQLGIFKRVTRSYRYCLTRIGRAAIAAHVVHRPQGNDTKL